jgi:hypothetical protein
MGIHFLVIVYIAKLNKLTESEVSEWSSTTVDVTSVAILK